MASKKGNKDITIIERLGLDGRIRELYSQGLSKPKIHAKLVGEGHNLSKATMDYWINTRIVKEKQQELAAGRKQKTVLQEASAELKLTEAVKEAWANYEKCKNDEDAVGASTWFKHYNELIEKLLKSTGVYEKAKQDAQKEDDKKIEVVWIFRTVCEKCGETLNEDIKKNDVYSMSDKQHHDIADEIEEELLPSAVIGVDKKV